MSQTILVPSFPAIDHEQHYHTCPFCKRHVYETNEICRLKCGDHHFPCANHLQHVRDVWGFLDDIVDVYIDSQQRQHFNEAWREGT